MPPRSTQSKAPDSGGEGLAWHDDYVGNTGGMYRNSGVDVTRAAPAGVSNRGYMVAWTTSGEWTKYTINVPTAGTYTLEASVSYDNPGGVFHVYFDEVDREIQTGRF